MKIRLLILKRLMKRILRQRLKLMCLLILMQMPMYSTMLIDLLILKLIQMLMYSTMLIDLLRCV